MKDWSRERWRKLYIREALEQRRWSVVTRGLRDYLIRFADDDGALIRDSDDPIEDLLVALGPVASEVELIRAAIRVLEKDGFLGGGARSLFVVNLPVAQASEHRASTTPTDVPRKGPASSSSKERVRRFRARQRQAATAELQVPHRDAAMTKSGGVTSIVTPHRAGNEPRVTGNATQSVTGPVTPSRGSRNPQSSENFLDLQKDKQLDLPSSSSRAKRVTSAVTSPVTAVTSNSAQHREPAGEDEEDLNLSCSAGALLEIPIRVRAEKLREKPASAAVSHPERWPEVLAVAQAFACAAGLPELRLGQYDRDAGLRAVVELYSAGFTQAELQHVATIVPKQAWWSTAGKRLGLSSMSIEVVRRNLPTVGSPRQASPTVAKVLASVQRRREAG